MAIRQIGRLTITRLPHRRFAFCLTVLATLSLLLLTVQTAQARFGLDITIGNVQVSHDTFKGHSEPAIAENPTNPRDLVAGSKFFTDPAHYQFKIGTFYSRDGGHTWHDSGLLPGFDSYVRTSDISLAFSPNGSLVYACVLAHGPGLVPSGIFVSRSSDGGKTWSDPTTVFVDPTGNTFSDKPWIAVDGTSGRTRGTVYVAWNLDGNSADRAGHDPGALLFPQQTSGGPSPGLVVARSITYGATFSPPVMVSPFDSNHDAIGAIPAVAPDGHVYIASLTFLFSNQKTVTNIGLATSTNRGKTFTPLRTVVHAIYGLPDRLPGSTFRNLSLPAFAVSPVDGSMTLAWADERFGDADILAVHSADRGRTWSQPVRVNHDAKHDGKDQFQPALAVAPDGVFTCSWFDRRYDPNNRLIDVVVAQSSNGLSFGPNIRVTRKSWDPVIDAPIPDQSRDTFIGDYQALAVDNRTVHPLWNDTQNGVTQEIRSAVIDERIFARR